MQKSVIQTFGFRNYVEDGKVVGFQFKVRNPYYRGVYLSQVICGYCTVDGEDIGRDNIFWKVGGDRVYSWQQMKEARQVHWNLPQYATIIVKKPGGLKQGFHDLRYSFTSTRSYSPPSRIDPTAPLKPDSNPEQSKATALSSEFGAIHHYRRLIMV